MAPPDSRTRSKITLNPSRVVSTSRLPSGLVPQLVLSNVLLVIALDAGKESLLDTHIGVFWVLMRVLACGGLAVMVWEGITGELGKRTSIEWSVLGMASLLLFVLQACLMTALYRLSAIRVVMFTHFSAFWMNALTTRIASRQTLIVLGAFAFSFLSDSSFSMQNMRILAPGYLAMILHGVATSAHEHTQDVLAPALGHTIATAATTLGATLLGLPFYMFRRILFDLPESPDVSIFGLLSLPFMAYTILFMSPNTRSAIRTLTVPAHLFELSYPSTMVAAAIIGPLAFSQYPTWSDLIVASMLFYGMYPADPSLTGPPRTPTSRLIRSYLKTVLSNPESRKIFYFLMLNLCYMLVQMLYGVWTNSLGLISDAIHMAFDCMAIGMGLLASVMATWPPNERFTYGYGRIETLSGFANGIFLILISIFIVFEAIQRILDPPEMNTNQLLLVSTLGLGVNLFGMFAMGGHHHHGHSHSHGHSHGGGHDAASHGHSHAPEEHSHTSPTHSHHAPHSPEAQHSHSHAAEDHGHAHTHSQSPTEHSHGHDNHSHNHSHGHSHDGAHTHNHDDHSHSHHAQEAQVPHSPPPFAISQPPRPRTHVRTFSQSATPPASPSLNGVMAARPAALSRHSRTMSMGPGPSPVISRHSRSPSAYNLPPIDITIDSPHDLRKHLLSPHSPDNNALSPPSATSFNSNSPMTPITPSYQFGHDDHFDTHHAAHTPNLHNHSHAPDHHEGHSHNMRGVFLHVMADTLGSVGVIISTLLIQFYGWTGFDPIASLFIAVLIVASVVPLVIDSGKVLCLDVGEREENIKTALAELPGIEGLASYSSPRFWPKDSSSLIGSIHIQLAPSRSSDDPTGPHSTTKTAWAPLDRVVERVDSVLRSRVAGLEELTIQVEGAPS
ncbi:cation efflux protein [Rickenella mellea]|uniref:Cation efflux protein n=1 Tax=Rickenella mellea TaxID=50990 RepID=A0A4Y7Q808_9AGAM|nr:cation efflux protein [Rickenella mellea]